MRWFLMGLVALSCSPAPGASARLGGTVDIGEAPPPVTLTAAASSAPEPKASSKVRRAQGGNIPCGKATCAAGREMCCLASGRCVPIDRDAAPEPMGQLKVPKELLAALRACQQVSDFTADVHLCSHSRQCGGEDRCVDNGDWAEILEMSFAYCTSTASAERQPERCETDAQCKGPSRICLENVCVKNTRAVACGTRTCGPRELCWFGMGQGGSVCAKTKPSEGLMFRHDCDGPEDCLSGQSCCAGMYNRCSYACGGGDTPVPICADRSKCKPWEPGECDKCGAIAK